MLIGLANIIPGVSGGTMAVIFKIYDRLINAIADIYKTPLKSLKIPYLYINRYGFRGNLRGIWHILWLRKSTIHHGIYFCRVNSRWIKSNL